MWSFWRKKVFFPFSSNTKSISTEVIWLKHTFFSISFFFPKQDKLDLFSNTIKYVMKNEVVLESWGHVLPCSSFKTKMVCTHYWGIQSQIRDERKQRLCWSRIEKLCCIFTQVSTCKLQPCLMKIIAVSWFLMVPVLLKWFLFKYSSSYKRIKKHHVTVMYIKCS